MSIVDKYLKTVSVILEASNASQETKNILRLQESELRSYIDSLLKRPDMSRVTEAHVRNTEEQRSKQQFLLSYNGGGSEIITSWKSLAKKLNLKESSIRVMLSTGKGVFRLKRFNPLIELTDILTVSRVIVDETPKPRRGRPPKNRRIIAHPTDELA